MIGWILLAEVLSLLRRHPVLALLSVALLGSLLLAGDSLAQHRGGLRGFVEHALERIIGVEERVAEIEEFDCGCPGVFDPVCANGVTFVNQCEASCTLGGLDRRVSVVGGPCRSSVPLCGEVACTAGRICVDGACVTDKCNGFPGQNQSCRATGCPRGLVCAIYPEGPCVSSACFCDPETGSIVCTSDCGGGACIPEG